MTVVMPFGELTADPAQPDPPRRLHREADVRVARVERGDRARARPPSTGSRPSGAMGISELAQALVDEGGTCASGPTTRRGWTSTTPPRSSRPRISSPAIPMRSRRPPAGGLVRSRSAPSGSGARERARHRGQRDDRHGRRRRCAGPGGRCGRRSDPTTGPGRRAPGARGRLRHHRPRCAAAGRRRRRRRDPPRRPAVGGASFADPAEFLRAHVIGTATVVQLCQELGIGRLVHVSSAEVYGRPERNPVDERAPTAPRSPYARSQGRRRERHRCGRPGWGLDAVVLRTVLGLRPRHPTRQRARPDPRPGADRRSIRLRKLDGIRDYCSSVTWPTPSGEPPPAASTGCGSSTSAAASAPRPASWPGRPSSRVTGRCRRARRSRPIRGPPTNDRQPPTSPS